jgi:integrase
MPTPAATRLSLVPPLAAFRRRSRKTGERVHLYLRGGTWWVQYTRDGRRLRESIKTDNRKIAEGLRLDLEYRLRHNELAPTGNIPLEPVRQEYLAYQKARKSPKGYNVDRRYLDKFLERNPVARLSGITTALVSGYLTNRRTQDGIAPKTANRIREVLHTFCTYAVNQGYLKENPVTRVARFPEPERVIVYLTKPQIEELLEKIRNDRVYPLVTTLIFAGLRRAEACWLRWSDVDLGDKPVLRIVAKTVDGVFWQPKTRRNRVVPLSPRLVELLKALPRTSPWVFPAAGGNRWDENFLTRHFRLLMDKLKLRWRIMDCRHTFGSILAQKGISLFKISKMMGNSPEICSRHYATLVPEEMHDDVIF